MNFGCESSYQVCQQCLNYRLCIWIRVPKPNFIAVLAPDEILPESIVMEHYLVITCGNCLDDINRQGHADIETGVARKDNLEWLGANRVIDLSGIVSAEVEAMDWPDVIGE